MTELRDFASPRQREILDAIDEHGSQHAAGQALGLAQSTISEHLSRLKAKAAQKGYAPEVGLVGGGVPEGFKLQGITTLVGPDGEHKLQWQKVVADKERLQALVAGIKQGLESELPKAKPCVLLAEEYEGHLLTAYPVGDHHLGMLSWGEETGEDYDMQIGQDLLAGAMQYLVDAAPSSEGALLVLLGDYFHYDSVHAITPTSKNMLDTDTRYQKMVRVGLELIRMKVQMALQKHKWVHIIVEIGNHDLATSAILMEALSIFYEDEPRVSVDTNPSHYHYFEFGKVLIGTHHGHGAKPDKLPMIMAADMPEAWGRTEYRYWWTGHIHHDTVKDFIGVRFESFRVLGPADAWAHNKGYRPLRDMKAIVLHKDFGEVARYVVNPRMLDFEEE
jgi:hypothetical protein